MALKNQVESPAYPSTTSSTRKTLLGALAIGAGTFLSPSDAVAQPQGPSVASNCAEAITGSHTTYEWMTSGQAHFVCGNTTSLPSETRARHYFNAFEAFFHATTDSRDIARLPAATLRQVLPSLYFNLRMTAFRAFDLRQLALPLSIGRDVTPERVAVRHRENEAVKAANIQAIDRFLSQLSPANIVSTSVEGRALAQRVIDVRSFAIQLLRVTDSNLSQLLAVYHDSLHPVANNLQVCGGTRTSRVNGEPFRILNNFLCARAGTLSYADFLRIATDPNLESALPAGRHWPTALVDSHGDAISTNFASTLGILVDGQSDMDSLVKVINEQFYLLHLYIRLVNGLDDIVVRQGGVSVVGSLRLTNLVATTPDTIARVVEPEHNPSVSPVNVPSVHPTPTPNLTPTRVGPVNVLTNPGQLNVTVVSAVDAAQLARIRALAAYQSRVRMWRIIGISTAGVGAITAGIGLGLGAANASAVQDVPNTPENRALHEEILRIRNGVYHTQEEVNRAQARADQIHAQFLASVRPYQNTADTMQVVSYVGLGVIVAGGAVAALAPVLAGSPPAQPSPGLVPSGGREGPHPAVPARRTENEGNQGGQFAVSPLVNNTTVGVTASGSF